MDDSTKLVAELLGKLADLDHKVNEYRQEMAQEFQRYSHQLLQHVPLHVRAQVEKIMASKMQNYPALNLDHFPALDSPSPDQVQNALSDHQALGYGKVTPPLTLPDASLDLPSDGTRSPHEREREFIGLFTPSYLPLLDAVQRPPYPLPAATLATPATPTSPPQSPRSPGTKESNGNQGLSSPAPSTPPGNLALSRPDPVRRGTGDTVSSNTSDDSASRTQRRSALRRSSSSSTKTQSPRRVRFEVEGQEVLPTMSPPISPRVSDLPSFPQNSPARMLDDSYGEVVLDDETGLLGSSPPRPKKLTSTDRLKAMARNSKEDTSNWTVVDDSQGLSDDEDALVMASPNGHSQAANPSSDLKGGAVVHRINDAPIPPKSSHSPKALQETEEDQLAGDDDDMNDILEMPALSSFKNKKRVSPPEDTETGAENQTAKAQHRKDTHPPASNSHGSDLPQTMDEEDMFLFDDNHDSTTDNDRAKATSKYIEEEEEEEEEEDEDEEEEEEGVATPVAGDQAGKSTAALYSRSPGVAIAKPPPPPPASALSKQIAASAGSYKGRPFSIGIVRDPELHKRAAEMGDLYSFVGSVDGRSGVDESSSYRPELASFSGTPKSFSERLLMEELEATHREASADKRD
ncbi:hypothetical protein F4810DRAFT_705336 [Camillea tinctor]|nr:hypothetical protein F4810DRAFT_705336 [Camillea tinctor]